MTSVERTQYRALVVDNHELVADSIVMVLLSAGFNAVAMYDPNRALEFATNGTFDLLLTDVNMPDLLSGMPATADLLRDAHRPGYDFEIHAKPTNSSELIDKVRELLES